MGGDALAVALLTGRALADRARTIRNVTHGARIEGRSLSVPVADGWWPCRLVPSPSREVEAEGGRRRIVETATLITRATNVQTADTLEVDSQTIGRARSKVSGTPQIVITRRLGRGVVLPLERLMEPPASVDLDP